VIPSIVLLSLPRWSCWSRHSRNACAVDFSESRSLGTDDIEGGIDLKLKRCIHKLARAHCTSFRDPYSAKRLFILDRGLSRVG
jgi:hypothetical protein